MEYLIHFVSQILVWLLQFFDWCLIEAFTIVGAAVVAVFNAIPVCGCFAQATTLMQELPPGVLYFAQAMNLSTGLQAVVCAVLLRFLIRRIPFIG